MQEAVAHQEVDQPKHPVHEELGGYEGAKLGMWLFLGTELLLFGVMFCGFALFHAKYVDEFKLAHHSLDKVMGGINTIVLIISSLTVALAIDAIQRGKRKLCVTLLAITIALAGVFLVVKYFEYSGKFKHDIFPGNAKQVVIDDHHNYGPIPRFVDTHHFMPIEDGTLLSSLEAIAADKNLSDLQKRAKFQEKKAAIISPKGIDLFFTFYFVMTGIHGAHVVIGMTVLAIVMVKAAQGRYTHWYYTPIENGGLYWHLVDLIWIYLFPLMYLIK